MEQVGRQSLEGHVALIRRLFTRERPGILLLPYRAPKVTAEIISCPGCGRIVFLLPHVRAVYGALADEGLVRLLCPPCAVDFYWQQLNLSQRG